AVAAECDDLTRTVERLDAVGLAKGGADGAVVEGADDPLLAVLTDPVARPECVEAGVDDKHRIARSEVAHRTSHSPRVNSVLAARRIVTSVLYVRPRFSFRFYRFEESLFPLSLPPSGAGFDCRSYRSDGAEFGWRAAGGPPRPLNFLDYPAFGG